MQLCSIGLADNSPNVASLCAWYSFELVIKRTSCYTTVLGYSSVLGQYMVYAGLIKNKQHEEVVLMLALGINPSNG